MKRKVLVFLLAVAMVITMLPTVVFAAEFPDMPNNWSTVALKSAVANGLLTGAEGKLMPNENLTRAQMAAVINRAFGATQKASLNSYTDVASGAWYYADMAKAVQMKTFVGSSDKLNPDSNITREEAFVVLARAFKLSGSTESALDKFSDKAIVSGWAKDGIASLVSAGYVAGSNEQLNPKVNITRAQFAQIMYNLLKNYIKTAGTYTEFAQGNVIINAPDVTLKNVTVKGDLIIGDGVGNGDVTLNNVKVTGRTVVRGGGINSIRITGNSEVGSVIIAKVDGNIRVLTEGGAQVEIVVIDDGKDDVLVEGKIGSIEVAVSNVPVVVQNAVVKSVTVTAPKANLTVDKDSTVETVSVAKAAEGTTITADKGATITNVKTEAPSTSIGGEGTVKNASIQGDNSKINTIGTKIEVGNAVSGTTSGGQAVVGGTTGTTTSGGGVTKPSTGGGSSTVAVSAITVTPTTMSLTAGGATGTITATITPANATNKNVNWSSSNLEVAGVENGVVTPRAVGTATITAASAADGTKTATTTVTVVPQYTLKVSYNEARGTVTGAGAYTNGAAVTLTATANEGYQFVNWTLNGTVLSTQATFQYIMPGANKTILANFIVNGDIPVATVEDLNSIRDNLAADYVQVANIDLGSSVYNAGEGWEPIYDFAGTFHGNGYKISNMMINRPNDDYESEEYYIPVGLFGSSTEVAVLKYIALDNVNVIGSWSVGGLVGENYGSIISSSVTGLVYGREIVGGLAGYSNRYIADSYTTCSVSGAGVDNYNIGGLVGANQGTITDSHATGTVTGVNNVGGLTGENSAWQDDSTEEIYSGQIIDCYATGTITGVNYVGGLTGGNHYWEVFSTGKTYNGTISKSYATGTITGVEYVGGLAGENDGTIVNSYAINPGLERISSEAETFGRITGINWDTLTNNFARSDMAEPFGDAFAEKAHDTKDGADLHSWQIEQTGAITIVPEKSIYAIEIPSPGIVEDVEATIAVTIAKVLQGYSGYENVGVNVSAVDAVYVELPLDWETGFTIGPDFDTTANITVLYNEVGKYPLELTLVDLNNDGQIIASKSVMVTVAYPVGSAGDLNDIRTNLDADYALVADIDLEGISWMPIGTQATAFTGSFYGNGYKISNLNINSIDNYQGLFGVVSGGIEDVVLENVYIVGTGVGIGGLVGYLDDNGMVKNSHVQGTVKGPNAVGVLVGLNWYGTIEECSAVGFVYGTGTGYKESFGGLVGRNHGLISKSFASVQVYSEGYCTGGLAGRNSGGEINQSYATGDVTATQSWAGGLVGDNREFNGQPSSIIESYATGKVTGGIGGLVGLNDGGGGFMLGTVEKSYYDSDTTTMSDDEGKGIPKETAEMKQQATFINWDFDDTWQISEGVTYPSLQWQAED